MRRELVFGMLAVGLLFVYLPSAAAQESIIVKSKSEDVDEGATVYPVEKKMKTIVSVDFFETPIDDVLRTMAMQADVDIVKNPEVVGDVTASLSEVPLDEALRNILAAHGYAYIPSENMILVVPKSQLQAQQEKIVNRVYRVTYADVDSVYKALKTFISKTGEIAVNPGTSNLMVTDTEAKIAAIDAFIEEVDRITPQIVIEARIYDITGKNRLDLGVDWGVDSTNQGTRTGIDTAFTHNEGKTNGINGLLEYAIINGSVEARVELLAQEQELNAKLLANPKIMALDNELAMIEIVTEIPYQELTETSQGGNIGTTEFRDVGVFLEVVPHVTRDNMVRLRIKPEFSIATGEVQVGGVIVDNPQPVVDTRRADTITLIESGQTVVIGGLQKREISQLIDKIPLLGDLPLIGAAFRFEAEEEINSELLVFITPRIVNTGKMSDYEAQRYRETDICMPEMTPLMKDREMIEKCGPKCPIECEETCRYKRPSPTWPTKPIK